MTEQPDIVTILIEPHLPNWALNWAVAQARAEPISITHAPSNEVNQVYCLDFGGQRLFLKVGPRLKVEYVRLIWLQGKLPAPRPVGFSSLGSTDAMLTHALEGHSLAVLTNSLTPKEILTRLAHALKALHSTPTTDWPFGGSGNVLVHGDACLPNFLFAGKQLSGYIDLGDMALGEPEVDLAAAVWSLQYNLGVGYGLEFLRQYGVEQANEEEVELLRQMYETGSCMNNS